MPAARDQSAVGALLRGFAVDVERLRVEPGRELDDLVFGDRDRADLGDLADLEVVEPAHEPGRYRYVRGVRTRKLGSLEVTVVGLGCNNFGGRIDEDATRAVVDGALESGVTFFDTADIYGRQRRPAAGPGRPLRRGDGGRGGAWTGG